MWNSHSKVALSQTIFYLPNIIAALYLVFFRHGRPRMPWALLMSFSIVRFLGGIFLIRYEDRSNEVGWIIVAIIFQGAGVIPLMLSLIGLLRLINKLDFSSSTSLSRAIIALRIYFVAGITTLIAGSVLLGNYKNDGDVKLGTKLAKTGYVLIASELVGILGVSIWLWLRRSLLCSCSRKVLAALLCATPFLTVRLIYACLSVFSTNPMWSTLTGSVAALVCMHSLMEYVVVMILLATGFMIAPVRICMAEQSRKFHEHVIAEDSRV